MGPLTPGIWAPSGRKLSSAALGDPPPERPNTARGLEAYIRARTGHVEESQCRVSVLGHCVYRKEFLDDIQQLVDNGTLPAGEGQAVDREIEAGRVDTDSLTSAGFTSSQLQAVQRALGNTKRGLAAAVHGTSK